MTPKGARERAENLDPSSANVSPRLRPLLGRSRRASDPYFSASPPEFGDEVPSLVTRQPERQPSLNYLGTAETTPAARRRSARSKKSSAQPGQPGQPPQTPRLGPEDESGERSGEQQESQWKRTLRYFKSVELENKGSVARDHLALGGFSVAIVMRQEETDG